ncbi:MAG: PHP domain-containing protein [Chloroflexi bacterium]|nr:PHP domain-containing protein [Chloroflexota bacterium]
MTSHLRVEFHCHTKYSKDSLSDVEDLLAVCEERSIDRLVITDHNTIAGALKAKELDPDRVIVGEEIMTQEGEILAAFVQEEIPEGLLAEEVIKRLREQGAFISVSHPFDKFRSGHWKLPDLTRIAPLVDAIETFNSRCNLPLYNRRARDFAKKHDLLGTAGSDAHASFEVGRATMFIPYFEDAEELRIAIKEAKFEAKLSAPWVHLTSRYAVWRKRFNQTP